MKVTLAIVLICMLVYIAMIHSQVNFIDVYGFSYNNMIYKPWTIITSIFVHADLNHLISNMLVLIFFGVAVEKELNPLEFLVVFFGGAFVGEVFSLFFYPNSIGVGASAAIFSIIGVAILLTPFDMSIYPYIVPVPLGILGILYAIYNIVAMFYGGNPSIDYAAHFGGLIFGLYYGFKRKGSKKSMITILYLTVIILVLYAIYIYLGK